MDAAQAHSQAVEGRQTGEVKYQKRSAAGIEPQDVERLRSIGRKSVNEFTGAEIQKTEKWARKFYRELGTKSPFFRAWFGDWRAQDTGNVNIVHNSDAPCNSAGKVKNVDTDKLVSWSSAIRGKTRIHAVQDKVAIQAVDWIEAFIQNSVYFESVISELSSKSKLPGTAWMYSFYSLYESGGKLYLLKLYIEEAIALKSNEVFDRAYQ